MNIFSQRIESIRSMLRARDWDAIVITGSDPHNSEYQAARWHQIEWISGYSGEGDLVITLDSAGLWTDSRYFIQANQQLPGTGIDLHKTRVPDQVLIPQWLSEQFEGYDDAVVAVDGLSQSAISVMDIVKAFKGKVAIVNAPDFIDSFWTDRPAMPSSPISILDVQYAGWSRGQKLSWLRKWLSDREYDAILISALDEVAWVLNVRGGDIAYNPVVMSYLLVSQDDARWFVRKSSLGADAQDNEEAYAEVQEDGVTIDDYGDIGLALSDMVSDDYFSKLFVDVSSLNYDLYKVLKDNAGTSKVVSGRSPVALRKAVKNEVEIDCMRKAHLEDGLAMERFLYWLDKMMESGDSVSEYDASEKLHELRSSIPGFRGESFETISAYEANAALPHYVTPAEHSAEMFAEGLYLCDSGGQYLFGTTDITRTVPLGSCTALEREDYTLVLKGHIDLAMAVFPYGTAGCQIDALAREPLWSSLRNFGHGTGHGVGFYLNVHEGPQDIRQNFNSQPLLPGMITSDEPGIYREGQFGIRHENLLLTVDAGTNEFGHWLRFEPLTLCHFDTSVIQKELLGKAEIDWLNAYNARVYETLSPHLPSDIASWLRDKTKPI
jgi:Xaa-Pro aminopeptidase